MLSGTNSFTVEQLEKPPLHTEIKNPQKNRPENTKFIQQKLPAWEPIHTAKSVGPVLLIITVYCSLVGAILLTESVSMVEVAVDYTNCKSEAGVTCKDLRENMTDVDEMHTPCKCVVQIPVTEKMEGPIKFYYGLSNFYQNHKFYIASRDVEQLAGFHKTENSISKDCRPYSLNFYNNKSLPIAPCGAIANSYFNDTFEIDGIGIKQTDIAWPTDSGDKFKNPEPRDDLTKAFENYSQPFFWNRRVETLDQSNANNNGYLNEPFELWMRTAAFANFRKAYGILDVQNLDVGTYNITVDYNFPVTSYHGTKRIIFTTTKWIGFKNNFLGVAHLAVGGVVFLCCIVLLYVQLTAPIKAKPHVESE